MSLSPLDDETLAADDTAASPGSSSVRQLDQSWLMSQLGYVTQRVSNRLKKSFASHPADVGLTAFEYSLMALINANKDVNQKQLGQALELSASSLTVILDRLVERGMVRRVRGIEDRRATFIHLTAGGAKLVHRGTQVAVETNAEAMQELSPGERMLLLELLQKIARIDE
jgi:DNA-binding MarR family transcriptional regulator